MSIEISFKKKAETVKNRSTRGITCIILKDTTVSGRKEYTRKQQITENYSEENKRILVDGFDKFGVNKLIVYSITGDATLTSALNNLKKIKMNFIALNFEYTEDELEELIKFVEERKIANMDVQAVVNDVITKEQTPINTYFDCMVSNDAKISNTRTLTDYESACWKAFAEATRKIGTSTTYLITPDITEVNDVDEKEYKSTGKCTFIFDGDKIKFSQAVTCLTTLGTDEKDLQKKRKIIDDMIIVKTDIYTTFRDEYVGKVTNDYVHRVAFTGNVNKYLAKLSLDGVLNRNYANRVELDVQAMRDYMESTTDEDGNAKESHDTSLMTDNEVLIDAEGWTGDKVFLKGEIAFVDATESLACVFTF